MLSILGSHNLSCIGFPYRHVIVLFYFKSCYLILKFVIITSNHIRNDCRIFRNVSDDRIFDEIMMLHKRAEKQFHRRMPLLLRLVESVLWVMLSHSELLCYVAMVSNAMVYGSIPSLVYPMAAFLWAMLSTPRPAKLFWLFVITYTQVGVHH